MSQIKGIDTSKWQASKVDYVMAKRAGYDFAFLRVGCGTTKDKCFEADYKSAIASGMKVGVYFYTYATTEAQAIEDATRVLGWLNNRHLDLPVVYDVENTKQKSTARKTENSVMYNAFAKKIRHHYEPMLYTGEYFFNHYFDKALVYDEVWIAKYSENQPSVGRTPAVWQFTSDAFKDDFYKAKLDRNYLLQDKWGVGADGTQRLVCRSNILKIAEAWLGVKESDGTHKAVIDVYNSHKPLARGYKVKYTDSWCATFVSAVAIKAGYTDIIPTECSCQKMIELFKKLGCWVELDSYVPRIGDVVFYDWQDNGSGDNTGWSDHVGYVQKVENGYIYVIEGNYNDAVKVRKIKVNGKYIRGFGVPRYAEDIVEVNPYPVPTRNLKRTVVMMKGNDVKWLQWELRSKGFLDEGDIDGKFGNDTLKAVKGYQELFGLKVDGIVGPATRYSMLND